MTAQASKLVVMWWLVLAGCGGGSGGTSGTTGNTTGSSGGTSTGGTTGNPMGTGSLQGPGTFTPNAVVALIPIFSDGGIDPTAVQILLSSGTPSFSCSILDAGYSGIVDGLAVLLIQTVGNLPLTTGPLPMGGDTSIHEDAGGYGFLTMYGPTSPPSSGFQAIGGSLSGSLTVSSVGSDWAGNFSTSIYNLSDGGQLQITGSFDTSVICQVPE